MIAQRIGHTMHLPETDETRLVNAIHRFAGQKREAFGVWRTFETDDDLLLAVLVEIEETVLPRKLRIESKETGASVSIVIANRRLVQIEEIDIGETGDVAEACIASLRSVFAGCQTLRFDLIDQSPELSRTNRSCSAKALMIAAGHSPELRGIETSFDAFIDEIRSNAEAWLQTEGTSSRGSCGDRSEIEQLRSWSLAHRSKLPSDQMQLHAGQPTLSILPAHKNRILIVLESQASRTFALFAKSQQGDVVTAWQAYARGDWD